MKSTGTFHLEQSTLPSSLHKLRAVCSQETAIKLSGLFLAGLCAVAVLAGLLLVLGVNFHRPVTAHGASLYNPATEVTLKGSVEKVDDFTCPVSEGEMGSHLMLKTADGSFQVHLAPGRIMRSQQISFAPGDKLIVIGSKVHSLGPNNMIAREIIRGQEDYIFRDQAGNLLMVQ
jgi:hypothetical protein